MKKISPILIGLILFSCSTNEKAVEKSMVFNYWEIAENLVHPESILLSPDSSFYFVSNIGTDESDSTPNGFISKVSLDGKILQLKWLDSIQSPKGQAIFGDKYYVSALDELLEISLKTGEILNSYKHDSIIFLNDVCTDDKGNIYVSGMKSNSIFCLDTNKVFSQLYQNDSLLHPNGVFWQNGNLYIGGWGESFDGKDKGYFMRLDLKTIKMENVITEKLGRLDGIQSYGDSFLVSSWQEGVLYEISKKGEIKEVLKTENSLGDFYYNEKDKTLVLPLNFQNKLIKTSLKN